MFLHPLITLPAYGIMLAAMLLLAVVAYVTDRLRRYFYPPQPNEPAPKPRPEGCCGQHEVCEKESLLAAVSQDIVYYDDEELDRFRGRESHCYTPQEVEEFEEILTTMRDDEVAGWVRSLQLRGVALPDDLKDQVLLIVGERRGT